MVRGYKIAPFANCQSAALDHVRLAGANLYSIDLRDAEMREANLSGAYLAEAKMSGTNLINAILTNANLSGANLRGAILTVVGVQLTLVGSGVVRAANLLAQVEGVLAVRQFDEDPE